MGLNCSSQSYSEDQYLNSIALTYDRVQSIVFGENPPNVESQKVLRKQLREKKRIVYKEIKENIIKNCLVAEVRRWEEKTSTGSGLWLHTLPNNNKPLQRIPKNDFHDALQLWLNITPLNIPRLCQGKECNSEFT